MEEYMKNVNYQIDISKKVNYISIIADIDIHIHFDYEIENQIISLRELVEQYCTLQRRRNYEITLNHAVLHRLHVDIPNTIVYLTGDTFVKKIYVAENNSNINMLNYLQEKIYERKQYQEDQNLKDISLSAKTYLLILST